MISNIIRIFACEYRQTHLIYSMSRKLLQSLFLLTTVVTATANDIFWYDGIQPVTYRVEGEKAPVVDIALSMFADDMALVTGKKAVPSKEGVIRIYQLDECQQAVSQLKKMGVPVDELMQKQDAFYIGTSMGNIIVVGSNGRGCAYGLLELSRMAGVSPWVWWGDVVPERKSRLTIDDNFSTLQSPSVEYRGIFINDEDWSLRNWSSKTFEPTGRTGIGPKTYKEIFKLLLRLRANAIWPAMHEGGTGFFTVTGNKEMADSCGIIIGTSHCEPLLRNNVAEWDKKKRGAYNYITNREQVQQYWTERLEQVKGSEELFTIGMRGIHDGSMEGVKTKKEKLHGLQQVIDDQRELIRQYYHKDVERVPQVFIPYKEVLEILESGLKVPDDVTLMWCDDNYGYLTRLSDRAQQRRSGGGGVYYHLSYWGRPHDYLWLTTTQPGLIYSEMKAAYDHQCRRLWIVNVHDPKVAAYDLELFLDMAWNIGSLSPNPSPSREGGKMTLEGHLERWLCTQFGEEAGRQLTPVMKEFYRLCGIRKPEFMGWTQSELDKRKYPRGMSEVGSIELTPQEAADRMQMFDRLKAEIEKCRLLIRPELADAYFAHIVYPIFASAAMTRKITGNQEESHQAYEEIQQLTRQYNALNGGKWQGLMDAAPRQLPVFGDTNARLQEESEPFTGVARNACDYQSSSPLSLEGAGGGSIQMLGHSMNAVSLPKGCELTYEFETQHEGDATLYTAMIPTQPNDRGDLRYSVQIDDQKPVVISLKEPYRSETWKKNVLRGQALKQTPVKVTKGKHTLKIKALDNHIICDQWMLDFRQDRMFYVIPVE